MAKAPFILLINPWITDFAAYDLWAKPLGLLLLASLLRDAGCGVAFLDCLDRSDSLTALHSEVSPARERKYGTGKYHKMRIAKPAAYEEMPRHYYRHGIHPDSFAAQLSSMPQPDLICVTSIMTYWYPGVEQAIRAVREAFPRVPVWLGGIYARLCTQHARANSGADQVITGSLAELSDRIESATGFEIRNKPAWSSFDSLPSPALDLVPKLTYVPLLTSLGCPFRCPYCASSILQPVRERRSAKRIHDEICTSHERFGLEDFAFYDDALLLGAEDSLKPALERICRAGPRIRFHSPNALHIRALTREWCDLLHQSGFTTVRLGLETSKAAKQVEWGGKVHMEMFYAAMENLVAAGFRASQIGVYLLCGSPGQTPDEVKDSIESVRQTGAQPHLAEYSPVPGTALFPEANRLSSYDLLTEPLYHNNSFFACRRSDFSYQDLRDLKDLARRARCA